MSKLRDAVSQYWLTIQGSLFPWLKEESGELTKKHQELVTTLELLQIERFTYSNRGFPGCPLKSRSAIARAFIAKMVCNIPTTRMLLDRLAGDITLRWICGWERVNDVPHESTFSRAFDELSKSQLPQLVHKTFIKTHYANEIVGHNSRDSTAIAAGERPVRSTGSKATRQAGTP
ncbi:Transposase domain [Nitrosomonas sp. Nm51]|uniref:transposase n=1 Tax=Nitrosomonas sp. Nm51 TaxID=133720 RepID=UPI0008BB1F31|nr:Transposase domain [Nitrosomonas sp. Nm51]